jgi:hypothetical protein
VIVRFPAAALAILSVLAVFTMGGCASGPRSRPEARDPDVAWVCARHDLVSDLRGRITFEDVQRTLCDVGRYSDRIDFRALEAAALAEAGRCGGTPAAATGPSSLRGLFEALERAAAGQPEGCVASAMIAGMVRALGRDYTFHPVGASQPATAEDQPAQPATLNKTIVYVKLVPSLNGGDRLVEDALRAARRDQAITGLMLDLRGADGAALQELARFIDFFIDDGTALEWKARPTGQMSQISATRRPPAETLPLIVLIDEQTQSGAEAFAGVLRARGRALLIGRRTMGRGTVQSIIDLPSGSRLRIPTGDLIEPGVGLISGRGVEPDVALGPTPAGGADADADAVIRFGVQVLSATRSGQRADLIDAAHRMLAWRSKR